MGEPEPDGLRWPQRHIDTIAIRILDSRLAEMKARAAGDEPAAKKAAELLAAWRKNYDVAIDLLAATDDRLQSLANGWD